MRRQWIGILSLLFSSFLFAVPANAANLAQCPAPDGTTEFVLIAEDNIIFEAQSANSGRIINGNVLVTSRHPAGGTFNNTGLGFVKIGANTNIRGTVIADVIILPDGGAKIQACIANTIIGSAVALSKGSCENLLPPPTPTTPPAGSKFDDFATAHPACVQPVTFSSLCGPTPTVAACANTANSLTLGAGDTLTIPSPTTNPPNATCFGDLKLGPGAVLSLGNAGPFSFKTVSMSAGARLIGPAGGATVNVNGKFNTEAGVTLSNIDLNIAQDSPNEVLNIFNNSILTNVNINAPFGKCHLHTDVNYCTSEACCEVLDVEPIVAECVGIDIVCICPANSSFKDNVSRACVCNAGFHAGPNNTCVPD